MNTYKIDGTHNVLFDCFSTLGLSQFILEPTRLNLNGNSNTLDLVLCNDSTVIKIDEYLPPFGTSDHCLINFSIYVSHNCIPDPVASTSDLNQPITLPVYDWSSGNYAAINAQLASIDWNNLFGYNFDANSLWESS